MGRVAMLVIQSERAAAIGCSHHDPPLIHEMRGQFAQEVRQSALRQVLQHVEQDNQVEPTPAERAERRVAFEARLRSAHQQRGIGLDAGDRMALLPAPAEELPVSETDLEYAQPPPRWPCEPAEQPGEIRR